MFYFTSVKHPSPPFYFWPFREFQLMGGTPLDAVAIVPPFGLCRQCHCLDVNSAFDTQVFSSDSLLWIFVPEFF